MDNASPTTHEQPTPPPAGGPTGPRVSRDEMKDLGRLRRSVTDRHIAGVAGGLARHLDVDPIIVRVTLVVAAFFGGAGLLAYLGAWILVPEEGTDDQPLGLDQRSRSLALAGVGVLAVLCAVGDWAGAFWFPWPLAIVAALVVWYLSRKERSRPTSGYGYEQTRPTRRARRERRRRTHPHDLRHRPTARPTTPLRSDRRARALGAVRRGAAAAAQPAPPRADPVLLHARARSRSPRASSVSSTSPAYPSPTAPTRRWPSGSSRRCCWSARSGAGPAG